MLKICWQWHDSKEDELATLFFSFHMYQLTHGIPQQQVDDSFRRKSFSLFSLVLKIVVQERILLEKAVFLFIKTGLFSS